MTETTRPSLITRVTQVALVIHAVIAMIPTVGWVAGFLPHASEHPLLARRAAAGHLAAVVMFLFVARRLRRDAALIVLPLAFVACNFLASAYEVSQRGSQEAGPLVPETIFLAVDAVFTATWLRGRRRQAP